MVAGAAVLVEDPTDMPYSAYKARYVRLVPDVREGIRRGVADLKAGRVTTWEEVKRELGIG